MQNQISVMSDNMEEISSVIQDSDWCRKAYRYGGKERRVEKEDEEDEELGLEGILREHGSQLLRHKLIHSYQKFKVCHIRKK